MPLYRDEAYPAENLRADLAALPLPGPALVIDVRSNTAHALPLVWDVATEIEDLTTELDLNQVPRWRYLAKCIDMLRISPLPPGTSLDRPPDANPKAPPDTNLKIATHFDVMVHDGDTRTFSKQDVVDLVFEHIDRLRANRSRAIQDRIGRRRAYEAVDLVHSAVRVFFLVDLMNETSLRSATSYANLLIQKDKDYGDPERTGRTKRLKTTAICINADPVHRQREFAPQRVLTLDPRTVFDMLIFIQSYRDDDVSVRTDAQSHEMELILYTLLLVSPEQFDTDHLEEQDITRHIMRMQGHEIPPFPCPIYMLGIASTEYSGRWSTRWLNYGLVNKTIEILQDSTKVEQGKLLLQDADRKDWLDEWWSQLQAIAPRVLPALLSETQVLDSFQQKLSINPFHEHPSLSSTLATLDTYCQRISELYKQTAQLLQQLTEEEPSPLVHVLQKILTEYGKENAPYKEEIYSSIIDIYRKAACFLVILFQDAPGMLPRAKRQLSELATRLTEKEHLAHMPDITKYRELFETEVKRVHMQLAGPFQIGHSFLSSMQSFLSGHDKQRMQMREEALTKLRSLAQNHLTEIRATLAAQLGFTLLEQIGLYAPDGRISACLQHVRNLDIALDSAREHAATQRNRADERLHEFLRDEQIDMAQGMEQQGLNSRKDTVPFQQVMQSYHELYRQLTSQDEHLKALSKCLLYQIGVHASKGQIPYAPEQHDNLGQPQMLGTELAAAMLSASATGYDLTHVQSLTNRYLDLAAQSRRGQAALVESVTTLQQIVKEAMLEQTIREQDFGYRGRPTYGIALERYKSVENILAVWVELQYAQDRRLRQVFSPISITTRLKEQHADFDYELEDLQRRGELLGYRESAQAVENDHFYLLFLPGPGGDEFAQALASTRTAHIERLHFPDREKLIYLHVHRIRSEFPSSSSSPDT